MGLLDFLYALNPLGVSKAEAGVLPPILPHKFGSRYIGEVAKKLPGFPPQATGGSIMRRLEDLGVVPKGFTDAYVGDPTITRDRLLERLSENWLRPNLHYIDESIVLPGSYLVEEYVPIGGARIVRGPLHGSWDFVGDLELKHPSGLVYGSLPRFINRYAPGVLHPSTVSDLKAFVSRMSPGQKGYSHYQRKFNELADEIERTLNLPGLREFDPDLILGQIPQTERKVVNWPARPGATKFWFMQMQFGDEPFELILAPSERILPKERTHFGLSEYVHVRGGKIGNDLFVQEIQSDWARQYTRDPKSVPKPPPEVVKKWPTHGVEAVLAYASNLPGKTRVIFADEPLISAIRGASRGTYPAYNEALRYAKHRANELGASAKRVPLNELVPDTPVGVDSRPLVVELTPKVKEAIKAGGSLLGVGGVAAAQTGDRRPATPLDALDELIQYMLGLK